jgi:hypothetical protein
MPNIDIAVDVDLKQAFDIPSCIDLSLPNAGPLKVTLPTGGTISAFADISKGIPTDCSMTFSLMLQIAPFLAATECLLKVLKLLKPLIDVIQGLPMPPVKAIQEFVKAAVDLPPFLLVPAQPSIITSLVKILGGLWLQLTAAQQEGNDELVGVIQCAQANAQTQAGQIMNSLGPVGVLLDLAGPLFGIAGIPAIQLPALGSASDLAALNSVVQTMQSVVATIQIVADGLGGCG